MRLHLGAWPGLRLPARLVWPLHPQRPTRHVPELRTTQDRHPPRLPRPRGVPERQATQAADPPELPLFPAQG